MSQPQNGPHEGQEFLSQFFKYDHLPEALQVISRPFGQLAQQLVLDPIG